VRSPEERRLLRAEHHPLVGGERDGLSLAPWEMFEVWNGRSALRTSWDREGGLR